MWWGWLAQVLLIVVGPIVWQAVKLLGFTALAYTGFDLLISFIRSQIEYQLSGIPSIAVSFLALMKFDVGINIILSAVLVSFALQGVRDGKKTVTAWNPPGAGMKSVSLPYGA